MYHQMICIALVFQVVISQENTCPLDEEIYPYIQDCINYDGSMYICPPFNLPDYKLYEGNITERKIFKRNCMCDRLCVVYGDCCDEVYQQLNDGKQPRWKGNYKHPSPLPKGTFACKENPQIQQGERLFVVDVCPAEWNDTGIQDMCESTTTDPSETFLTWPVTDTEGILYRNMYCAVCHNQQEYLFWKLKVDCQKNTSVSSKEDLKKYLRTEHCQMKFSPPDFKVTYYRLCKHVIGKCSKDWQDDVCNIRSKCENGPNLYVYTKQNKVYRNKYCAKCNNESQVTCEYNPPLIAQGADRYVNPMSIIFDINIGSGSIVGEGLNSFVNKSILQMKHCSSDKVYDPTKDICRSLSCLTGYNLIDGQCINSLQSDMDCPRIFLNQSEFDIFDNLSLYVWSTLTMHQHGFYELTSGGNAIVCSNLTQNYTWSTTVLMTEVNMKFSHIQTLISMVGQIISLVGLFIQLLVYYFLHTLRNLAGKNLMCLSTALFCGQLLFLTGNTASEQYTICALLSILTHYAFFAAFAWMNIMAFDIWKTFANTSKAVTQGNPGKRFLRYCIFGWGVALVIVIAAIILNYIIDDSYFRPGYGETICWIRYRPALLIFFAIPVGLIITINLIFYILTIISIYQITKITKVVTQKADKTRLWLYIKLTSIMGLTWIFGFVAAIFDSHVLWYFFIIFNSLQGAFICVFFVFTKQVYNLMRDHFWPAYMALSTTLSTTARTSISETKRPSKATLSEFQR